MAGEGAGPAFQASMAIGSGYVQARALRDQADYEKKVAELNNKAIDYQKETTRAQAADAEMRGKQAAAKSEQGTRLQVGEARAAMAAQGVLPGEAQALEATNQIQTLGAAEKQAIEVNTWREAFGYRSQVSALSGAQLENTLQARTRENALRASARSSMITGYTTAVATGLNAAAKAQETKGIK